MATLTLDAAAIGTIRAHFGSTLKICDETGRVHATIIPEPTLSLEEMLAQFTPEQLARRADWSKPGIPNDVVARQLGLE